ncbi:MAG: hypothetical protein K2K54_04875 [Lachnospiraceae bacterium]|nr:hypothetical protein [Lachnospiraceae bacterium]
MYSIKQRILSFILVLSLSASMFLDCSITVSANSSVAAGFVPRSILDGMSEEASKDWDWKGWFTYVVNTVVFWICDASALTQGDFEKITGNAQAFDNYIYSEAEKNGMLSEIYFDSSKDSLDKSGVKCSTAFIDWLCKELNAYYVSVNKENISDYYDKIKGYYDYGSTNDVSYDLLYGSVQNGKVGVRMFQHFAYQKTLTSQYPIYGLLAENKNAMTGTTYYMADLYFYNPLLADKVVEYPLGNGMKINVQAVKNGLALGANSNYAVSQGIPYIYTGSGANSSLGSLYILEDGSLGSFGGYSGSFSSSAGFYNLPSIALSDPANIAKNPGEPTSTWKYTNLLLRTKIPFFDSYEKLEKAYKTGDLTEAVNFSKLSAFAGGYSGDDVTLDSDTLKAIEKILNDNSLDIQDKIDQIGDLIGGAIGDNTEEIKKTNSWLAKIKAVLDDILSTLKSIRRWTIADTIIDAIDAVVDGADFVKNIITDIINVGINIVKAPGSAFGSILDTVETLGEILKVKFPFCIPWDIAFLVGILSAAPRVPHYEIPIKYGGAGSIIQIDEMIVIDFTEFSAISRLCRTFLFVIFCRGLLDLTIKIVNMKEGEYDRS